MDDFPSYSPDGSHVAFLSGRGGTPQVWVMARDGTSARALTESVEDILPSPLSWTPGGDGVVMAAQGRAHLVRLADGARSEVPFTATVTVARWTGLRRPEVPAPGAVRPVLGISDPALSPDGSRMAFSAPGDVWIASTAGGPPTRLTHTPTRDEAGATWAPDGKRVTYFAAEQGSGREPLLILRDWAGPGPETILPQPVSGAYALAWSPDGRHPPGALIGFSRAGDSLTHAVTRLAQDTILGMGRGTHSFARAPLRDSAAAVPWAQRRLPSAVRAAWNVDLSRAAWVEGGVGYWIALDGQAPPTRIADPLPRAFSWSADGGLPSYLSLGRLRLLDVSTGEARTLEVAPTYTVAAEPPPLVIRKVRVVDGRGSPPTGALDVVVERGRIARVGTGLRVDGAPREIDGSGKTLLPGLFDLHVHLFGNTAPSPLFLRYGVTTVRDLGARGEWTQGHRERAETGVAPLPRVLLSAGQLTGDYRLGDRTDGLAHEEIPANAEAAKQAAAALRASGADVIKVYWNNYGFEALAADAAHAVGLPVTTHFLTLGAVARGLEGKEHANFYQGGPDQWTATWREDALALTKAAETCVTPTLMNYIGLTRGRSPTMPFDTTLLDDDDIRRHMNPALLEALRRSYRTPLPPVAQATWDRRFAVSLDNVRRMNAAG